MPQILLYPKFKALNHAGQPLSGGKVHTYTVGTTTNKATYPTAADAIAGTNELDNPVILDADGEATIYIDGSYKILLKDSDDVTQWTCDNVQHGMTPAGIDDLSATDAAARTTLDPYPATSLSRATTLEEEIQQLRYLIAQITGETYWYIDPDSNMVSLAPYDVLTTRGDIIRRNASAPGRLALGSSGQVLASDGTDVVWADTLTAGEISGLDLSLGTDTAHDIDIAIGGCRDSLNGADILIKTAITRQLDAEFGTGDGGMYVGGTVAASTKYHLFAIKKDSDGTGDVYFDTSSSAANIATGYTESRLLGILLTDSDSDISDFFDYRYRHSTMMQTGTYLGSSSDGRILECGIDLASADYVWLTVKREGATKAFQFFGHGVGVDESFPFDANGASANYIQDIVSTGFELGTGLNALLERYHYVLIFQYGDI